MGILGMNIWTIDFDGSPVFFFAILQLEATEKVLQIPWRVVVTGVFAQV